jgi:hypothetical protein
MVKWCVKEAGSGIVLNNGFLMIGFQYLLSTKALSQCKITLLPFRIVSGF